MEDNRSFEADLAKNQSLQIKRRAYRAAAHSDGSRSSSENSWDRSQHDSRYSRTLGDSAQNASRNKELMLKKPREPPQPYYSNDKRERDRLRHQEGTRLTQRNTTSPEEIPYFVDERRDAERNMRTMKKKYTKPPSPLPPAPSTPPSPSVATAIKPITNKEARSRSSTNRQISHRDCDTGPYINDRVRRNPKTPSPSSPSPSPPPHLPSATKRKYRYGKPNDTYSMPRNSRRRPKTPPPLHTNNKSTKNASHTEKVPYFADEVRERDRLRRKKAHSPSPPLITDTKRRHSIRRTSPSSYSSRRQRLRSCSRRNCSHSRSLSRSRSRQRRSRSSDRRRRSSSNTPKIITIPIPVPDYFCFPPATQHYSLPRMPLPPLPPPSSQGSSSLSMLAYSRNRFMYPHPDMMHHRALPPPSMFYRPRFSSGLNFPSSPSMASYMANHHRYRYPPYT